MSYQIKLALLSLRKTPALSALIIVAIGLGIGVFMTVLTVHSMMGADPIPAKSGQLYTFMLDNREADADPAEQDTADEYATYTDVMNILQSDIPSAQSVHYPTTFLIHPDNEDLEPFVNRVRLANNGFFDMFDVPFQYGAPWSSDDEASGDFLIVLDQTLNEKLFAGQNSVGRKVRLDEHFFEVIGVTGSFSPMPKYFELDFGRFRKLEGAYIPFALTPVLQKYKSGGRTQCSGDDRGSGFESFINAECRFIHHWVQLDDSRQLATFSQYLDNYALEQRQYGRFLGPINHQVHDVMSWLTYEEVVDDDYRVLLGIALMFLSVCVINAIGLLVAKNQRRAGEFSLYRALGASKKRVMAQNLTEVALMGLCAGVLGLLCALAGLLLVRQLYSNFDQLAQLNPEMVAIAILVSIGATMLAGLYPAWRVAQLPPAAYLKLQ